MATPWTSPSGEARFDVAGGRPFHLDDAQIATTFRHALPPRIADLLDIAMECYATDRLTTRNLRDPFGRGWCRSLTPVVAVRDLDFWTADEVSSTLVGLLDWLTDDQWDPCFVKRKGVLPYSETQGTLFSFRPGGAAAVACHSGGLDSLAGAAIDLGEQPDIELLLVGASGTSRARALQRHLGEELAHRSQRAWPLLIKANLVRAKRRPQDRRQRTRGIMFLSLASAVAIVARVAEVRVYENGVGAINLPYSEGQIGAHMARSAHPQTLLAMQELIELLDYSPVRFKAGHIYETKAQLTARVPEQFADLIAQTISCDSWSSDRQPAPADGERAHRCGRCSSCLLRRQSLQASDYQEIDDAESYRSDAFADDADNEQTYELQMMLNQVGQLQTITTADQPWARLVETYPQIVAARDALTELGEPPAIEERLVAMYRSYVHEWGQIDAPLVTRYLGATTGAHA